MAVKKKVQRKTVPAAWKVNKKWPLCTQLNCKNDSVLMKRADDGTEEHWCVTHFPKFSIPQRHVEPPKRKRRRVVKKTAAKRVIKVKR